MKTLTKDNISRFIFDDAEEVTLTDTTVIVGTRLIIADCNSSDSVLHEGVVPPDDWAIHMYTYDGTAWALNPDYSPPPELDSDGNPIYPIPE